LRRCNFVGIKLDIKKLGAENSAKKLASMIMANPPTPLPEGTTYVSNESFLPKRDSIPY